MLVCSSVLAAAIIISPQIGLSMRPCIACDITAIPSGFALFAPLSVSGQMCVSVVLDHIGFLGAARKPISWQKCGALAVIFGGLSMMVHRIDDVI